MSEASPLETLIRTKECSPLVFSNIVNDWPAAKWTPYYLANELEGQKFRCKIAPLDDKEVLWETDCVHFEITLKEYVEWLDNKCKGDNPLSQYNQNDVSCYIDYKYMKDMFYTRQDLLKAVDWSVFGLDGRDGHHSTVWIGSTGCYTNCHYDSYGFNLIAQIYGRKKWTIFPPSESNCLYPTRIPYEESSVFSEVNVKEPDLKKYPKFRHCHPYIVTLEPGQVMYLPKHWWHFVESLEPSLSINTWVDLDNDKESRIEEAMTRLLFSTFLEVKEDVDGPDSVLNWVNPGEEIGGKEMNIRLLLTAFKSLKIACTESDSQNLEKNHVTSNNEHVTKNFDVTSCECSDDPTAEECNNLEKFVNFCGTFKDVVKVRTCVKCQRMRYQGNIERNSTLEEDLDESHKMHSSFIHDEVNVKRRKFQENEKDGVEKNKHLNNATVYSLLPISFDEYINMPSLDSRISLSTADAGITTNASRSENLFCKCETVSANADANVYPTAGSNIEMTDPLQVMAPSHTLLMHNATKKIHQPETDIEICENISSVDKLTNSSLSASDTEFIPSPSHNSKTVVNSSSDAVLDKFVKCLLHPRVIKTIADFMYEDERINK